MIKFLIIWVMVGLVIFWRTIDGAEEVAQQHHVPVVGVIAATLILSIVLGPIGLALRARKV
jgi:hypothetical protein